MSGWQLGLALFGCWLAGAVCCGAAIYFYARRVFAQKMGLLAGILTGATPAPFGQIVNTAAGRPSGSPLTPPEFRPPPTGPNPPEFRPPPTGPNP